MPRFPVLSALLLSTLLLVALGCGTGSAPREAQPHTTLAAAASVPAASCAAPLKVAVMQDKSGSATQHRTPQLAPGDLAPVIERLRRCGGELAVGLINERSNRSLLRLYVPVPALKALPPEPSRSEFGNAFDFDQAMTDHRKDHAAAEAASERALAQHRRAVATDIEAFKAEVQKLLGTTPDAQHTDIWGAIRRAELFLAEPDPARGTAPRKMMIVVSDAEDNAGRPSVALPLESGAQVLLVNGKRSPGAFEGTGLDPAFFESISSAVRYLERTLDL